ncbi:MAG: hypothetical protein AABY18_09355 [Candidatus Thermoplasmatota archaeon]
MVRLQCPNCANVIDAPAGTTPRCPACGFLGAVTMGNANPSTHFGSAESAGPQQRPGWVLAVAILQFINGGFAILGGLAVAFFGTLFAAIMSAFFGPLGALGGLLVAIGLVIVIFGVLYVLLAMQVLKGRDWARITSIVLSSISGAFGLLSLMGGNFTTLFSLAFDVLIIVGLCLPESRAWFARQSTGQRQGYATA